MAGDGDRRRGLDELDDGRPVSGEALGQRPPQRGVQRIRLEPGRRLQAFLSQAMEHRVGRIGRTDREHPRIGYGGGEVEGVHRRIFARVQDVSRNEAERPRPVAIGPNSARQIPAAANAVRRAAAA